MAEVNLGDLTAYVRADISHFERGLQQVMRQLTQLQRQVQGPSAAALRLDVGDLPRHLQAASQQLLQWHQRWQSGLVIVVRLDTTRVQEGLQQAQQQLAAFQQRWAQGLRLSLTLDTTAFERSLQAAQGQLSRVQQQAPQQTRFSAAPVAREPVLPSPVQGQPQAAQGITQATQSTTQWAQSLQLASQAVTQVGQAATQAAQGLAQFSQQTRQAQAALSQFQQQTQPLQQQLGQVQQRLQGQHTAQQQAQQSIQQLATAYLAMAQAIRQYAQELQRERLEITRSNQALRERQQQLRDTAQASRGTGGAGAGAGALAGALQVAGGIGIATTIAGITAALVNLGKETVVVAARMEALRATFSAIAGNTQTGAQQFEQLFQTAQRLGVGFEPLARGWRTLTAAASQANLPLIDQQRLLNAVAAENRRLGGSGDELQRALLAIGQSAAKGRVSMEELRQQLGEAMPTAFAATAQGMGKTTEELTKLVEAGRLGFVPFVQALTRGLEQLQAKSGEMHTGIIPAFNRLLNSFIALRDTVGQSGVLTFLASETEKLRAWIDWINQAVAALNRLRGVRQAGDPQEAGPTIATLGPSEAQRRELEGLNRIINAYTRQAEATTNPRHREQYLAQAAAAREQHEQLIESLKATQAQTAAQNQATAAANQTTDALARQKTFTDEVQKALTQINKDVAAYREQAALAPERFGRPGGTTDEVTEYNKGLQNILGKQLEQLAAMVQGKEADVRLTKEQQTAIAELDQQYGRLGKQITSVRETEQTRRKEAREAQQQAERAVNQEIQLRAQLEQVKAVFERPEETTAARARTQAIQQFVQAQRTIDQALAQLADNPALRARVPAMQQQFEALKAALPGVQEAAGLKAFQEAQKSQQAELRSTQESLTQLFSRLGVMTLSPLEAELSRIRREFVAMADEANTFVERLTAMRPKLEVADQAELDRMLAEVQAAIPQISGQLDAALQVARDKQATSVRTQLREAEDGIDQLAMRLSAAGLSPLEADLARIDREFARMTDDLTAFIARLQDLRKGATTEQQPAFDQLVNRLEALQPTVEPSRFAALEERRTRSEMQRIEALEQELERLRIPPSAGGFPFELPREQLSQFQKAEAASTTEAGRERIRVLREQILAQEQLNYGLQLFSQLAQGIGSAWTQALTSIADGTKTVSEAFRAMGQAILQTMTQIAAQEATRAFIQLGFRLLTGAFTSSVAPSSAGPSQLGTSSGFIGSQLGTSAEASSLFSGLGGASGGGGGGFGGIAGFQHGGVVRRPTIALLGENPANNPETILNRQQMASMMQGTARGAQTGGVTVINVASRQQAEQTAIEQKALGRQTVINYINENLSLGESSSILRNLRALQR